MLLPLRSIILVKICLPIDSCKKSRWRWQTPSSKLKCPTWHQFYAGTYNIRDTSYISQNCTLFSKFEKLICIFLKIVLFWKFGKLICIFLKIVLFQKLRNSSVTPLGSVPLKSNAQHWSEEIVDKDFKEHAGGKLRAVYIVQPRLSSRGGYFAKISVLWQYFTINTTNWTWSVVQKVFQFSKKL